ncbi:hypothetical protein GpSGHVEth166 [Glossina pallidipes salivary gland hypertrophy virus]|uniref:Uncharacterized protein n=1 Tax=Glossina hytrovirus (isolate Glossina pallidipes/Ethiopia/Seibersdorf/-) TaxID=379529 RepID=A0A0Y0M3N1_GHVS|nr:hypothetical protein GpSGHVEth166 [Glossina pallidipes salivary gland hypertrophy virus]
MEERYELISKLADLFIAYRNVLFYKMQLCERENNEDVYSLEEVNSTRYNLSSEQESVEEALMLLRQYEHYEDIIDGLIADPL